MRGDTDEKPALAFAGNVLQWSPNNSVLPEFRIYLPDAMGNWCPCTSFRRRTMSERSHISACDLCSLKKKKKQAWANDIDESHRLCQPKRRCVSDLKGGNQASRGSYHTNSVITVRTLQNQASPYTEDIRLDLIYLSLRFKPTSSGKHSRALPRTIRVRYHWARRRAYDDVYRCRALQISALDTASLVGA